MNDDEAGRVIGAGGFGCVFYPSLRCKNKKMGKNLISKLSIKKEVVKEQAVNDRIKPIILKIKNHDKYFLINRIFSCTPKPINKKDLENFNKCVTLLNAGYTEENINKNLDKFDILNVPYGGEDLAEILVKKGRVLKEDFIFFNKKFIDLLENAIYPMNKLGLIHCDMKSSNLLIDMKKLSLIIVGMIFIVPACTNLDEELYSDLAAENFFTTDEENIAALGQAYSSMTHWGSHTNIWTANELSSDELVIPTRGGDWYDGGILLQLHQHEFQPDNNIFNNAWNNAYGPINTVNRLIYQFSSIEGADAYEAELRAIRAFYYFHLLDMFGNVPLSTDFTDTETKPNSTRSEVYNFVKSELDAVIPLLSEKKDATTYGRINKWAALAIRIQLLLNA